MQSQSFLFDIETLGTESNSVVLSVAILPFHLEEDKGTKFTELVSRARFFKLSVEDQIKKGRVTTPDTIDWWSKQSEEAKDTSFRIKPADMSPADALKEMRAMIHNPRKAYFWQRGSLDQVCFESLCRTYKQMPLIGYYNWRDIRTALNCFGKDAQNYNKIEGCISHHPVHDCAKDVIELLS